MGSNLKATPPATASSCGTEGRTLRSMASAACCGVGGAPALALLVSLAGCGAAPDPDLMSGYAEADLLFVAAPSAGTVRDLAVHRGDAVQSGQTLFALDTEAERLAVSAAQARQQRAEAQTANLRKGRRPAELQAIDAQLAQADAALAASGAQLDRQQRLVAQGFVSALQLDELRAAHDRDLARKRELTAQRSLALQSARQDEVAAAAAEARGSQSDVELAQWRAGQRLRQAPQPGRVFDLLVQAGEWVNAGTPVVALMTPQALKVRFFVPQAQLARVAVGRAVAVSCDGCPDSLRATVRWVSPQAEYTPPVIYSNASRSKLVFMVEADPDDGTRALLKPGQALDVRLGPDASEPVAKRAS
jgi:HlyD family secretion protein